ncbi:MAG TPA: hypothetical protein VFE47_05330 [Tepidisphaeraceae bacterium]|jgi:hypothetical protein|nr:hypothetical protein [Tepidisphaeraceae bacterium]
MSSELPRTGGATSLDKISAALRRGDLPAALRLLGDSALSPESIITAAEAAMRERRWSDAALYFDHVPDCQGPNSIKRCLSRNLAAVQRFRPDLYDLLVSLPRNDNVGIGASATGHPTIVCRRSTGRNIALSPGNLPLSGLGAALVHLKPIIDSGTVFALGGIGDGYLLHQLAQKPPALYLDTEQSVFVLEPNAHIVLTAMMIHDYTGPMGPIEQARFQWFIGAGWERQFRAAIMGDLMLPCPHVTIALGLESDAIQKVVDGTIARLQAGDEQYREIIENYYASLKPAELTAVFGENPPRKPRVLFLTTRFSTVLQFSTRDTVAAFQEAGWETDTLIEPTLYHRIMTVGTRQRLANFKPDLVFQIDHHRHEHPEIFPPNLPFVCWIQDHMEQLMTPQAGAQVGARDFVLTDAGPLYVHNYGYPGRQIIAMPKLTAPPALLPREDLEAGLEANGHRNADKNVCTTDKNLHATDKNVRAANRVGSSSHDDLVYISNNTRSPQALLDVLLHEAKDNAAEKALLTECWRRLVELHDAGETVPNYVDVCRFLGELAGEMGIAVPESRFTELARVVNHPVCDALYRQQVLGWAMTAAEKLELKLGLYGKGWENHPKFSAFARGPLAPGREVHETTRRAAINFQISPYLCLHQRLLDGICAGGFFLVRRHMADVAPQAMLDLLETHCGSHVRRVGQARACTPPPVRERFERLLKECQRCLCFSGTEDPIEAVRAFEEARLLQAGTGVLPHLDEISFSNAADLRRCIERYAGDSDLRQQIILAQRQSIVERFTYAAAMRRAVRRMGEILSAETSNAFIGIPVNIDIGRAA